MASLFVLSKYTDILSRTVVVDTISEKIVAMFPFVVLICGCILILTCTRVF